MRAPAGTRSAKAGGQEQRAKRKRAARVETGKTVLLCAPPGQVRTAIVRALTDGGMLVVVQSPAAQRGRSQPAGERAGPFAVVRGTTHSSGQSERLVERAWGVTGRVDALVIQLRQPASAPGRRADPGGWDATFSAWLREPFFLAQHAGLRMAAAGGGQFVIVASGAARARRLTPAEEVAMAGLVTMTHGLAKALSPAVRVCAIVPGPVEGVRQGRREMVRRAPPAIKLARAIRFLLTDSPHAAGAIMPVG